jgi:pyruvate dehydrogenase E2 component (dihydrolipoamide acetyltransferase)
MIIAEIKVPLLNANEPEAQVINIHVVDGQFVHQGNLLFSLETTKATAEIDAPVSGYARIHVAPGDTVSVGAILAVIVESKGDVIEMDPRSDQFTCRQTHN